MRFTDEQTAVIETQAQRFAVRAAAGSGKTSVLVERYIRQVVTDGLTPDEIVTLTFSRKAAAEMKTRIVKRLRAIGRVQDAIAAETGPIQTLHGYCERILRENSIEANIDPMFEVMNPSQATIVRARAVREAIVAGMDGPEPVSKLIDGLAGKLLFKDRGVPHSYLRKQIDTALDAARGSGVDADELLSRNLDEATVVSTWRSQAVLALPDAHRTSVEFTKDGVGDLTKRLKAARIQVPEYFVKFDPETEARAAADSAALAWLVAEAWSLLDDEFARRQEFDFTAMEAGALRLLRSSEHTRNRIHRMTRVVMIDESQDLNPVQYELVKLITSEHQMMVGDPRQSIYGFRFADSQLFVEHTDQVETYDLSVNHRSDAGILSFVGQMFGPAAVAPAPSDDPFATAPVPPCDGVELWPFAAADTKAVAAAVKRLIDEGEKPSDIAVLCHRNSWINHLVDELTPLGIECRIVGGASTFYTRLEVRDLASAMDALCDPSDDHALLATLRSPLVNLGLDATVWLAAHAPVAPALLMDGPWDADDKARIDRFLEWLDQGRALADRISAWELISFLLDQTDYLAELARLPGNRQTLANVRKLLSMAASEPECGPREFSARMKEISWLRQSESEAPAGDDYEQAVNVMTIHKAKGLEFEVVVVPQLFERFRVRPDPVLYDLETSTFATMFDGTGSSPYNWAKHKHALREEAERKRVMYVAMTRAKRRLCLFCSESGGHGCWAEVVAKVAGYPKSPLPGIAVRPVESE